MDQELQDIVDHMDLSDEDSRELLYRFLLKYSVKIQAVYTGPIDPGLDILCRQLIEHDTIAKAVERKYGEYDLERAKVKEAEVLKMCRISDDGGVYFDVTEPGTKPFFLLDISSHYGDFGRRHNIITDGEVWYSGTPAPEPEPTFRLVFSTDRMSQSDRKVILQAIEEYVRGQEEES